MGVGILSDCVFFLRVNSLPFKEKSKLKTGITSNGGAISLVLNEKCTHVVVISTATLNSTQQKTIQKHRIPVVNPDFIWKSIQAKQLAEIGSRDDSNQSEEVLEKVKDDKKSRFLAKFLNENKENLTKRDFKDEEEFEDDGEEGNLIPEDTEVAKYCFLEKDDEVAIVELLWVNEQSPFPFKICTTYGTPDTSQKELTFHQVGTSESACEKYELRINDLRKKGFVQVDKIPPQAESFASHSLQKVLIGEAISVRKLSPEVADFVECIWIDALGHLDAVLSCPVENISLNDVSKAEGILHQIRNALTKGDRAEDIRQMMLEFYQCIPHKEKRLNNIIRKFLTVKQDLCQLIRDMVNVCETNLLKNTINTMAKYQALRCRVEKVDTNTEEFERVQQEILDNNHSNEEYKILHVFRIGRLSEATNFKSDVGNVKSLLHASAPCRFVGILSRGLMLPKMIVEEFGLERTDIGNLGSGIYFSDSISTSVKYAECSAVNGARLLVLCDVALGNTSSFYKRDYTLTEPPSGFHSVLGVRSQGSIKSDFTDNEYVVYNVDQVKMRYVVQFCTANDSIGSVMDIYTQPEKKLEDYRSPSEPSDDVSLEELPETDTRKAGLLGSGGQQIPLQSIHIKARLIDLAAQVVIFQTYKNDSSFPIESKYVFPLDSTAAVCGFEAFINGKHIIGEVKEKQQARREYRAAISEGHGAYLMDQDSPDVFTVSVGNLPAKSTVVIKISYVSELTCQYNFIQFSIPGTVASWQQDKALNENTQDAVTKVGIESDMATKGSFCLDMSIEMPRKIESINCYGHTIKIKKTDCKAVIQTVEDSSLSEEGFSVDILMEDSYIPRMWVETHPDLDSEACMLIFQPQFEDTYQDTKLTICLDCSNSMESCFHSAKLVALLALSSLSTNHINLVLFGSTYKEFYFYPKYCYEDRTEMEKFIKMAKPNMGSTEFWKPLQSLCLLRPTSAHQKVVLISDGHLQNENLVFQILKKNKEHINLFTYGVGSTANKHMLRSLAQRGTGAFEFFADKSKSSWKDQMEKQYNKVRSPACTAVSVKWRQFERNPVKPVQAPASIQALFPNDNLFVYGFVRHCTQATLKALLNNEELENMVSTTDLQKTTGTILHKLTARALIKDYEDGILHEKEHENEAKKQELKSFIIDLSMQHSIVTQFTSFVAVEKRNAEEDLNIEPDVLKIISEENVDILPYMGWTDDGDSSSKSSPEEEDQDLLLTDSFMCQDLCNSADEVSTLQSATLNSDMDTHYDCAYEDLSTKANEKDSVKLTGDSFEPLPVFSGYQRPRSAFGSPAVQAPAFSRSEGLSLFDLPVFLSAAPPPPAQTSLFGSAVESEVRFSLSAFGSPAVQAQGPGEAAPVPSAQSSLFGSAVESEARFSSSGFGSARQTPAFGTSKGSALFGSGAPPPPAPTSLFGSAVESGAQYSWNAIGSPAVKAFGSLALPVSAACPIVYPPQPPTSVGPAVDSKIRCFLKQMKNITATMKNSEPQYSNIAREMVIRRESDLSGTRADTFRASKHPIKEFQSAEELTTAYAPLPFPMYAMKKKSVKRGKQPLRDITSSWPSIYELQSQDGFWQPTPEFGLLLNINVCYLSEVFLLKKGICSLGSKGIDEILKLIATLLVLQMIHVNNMLCEIKFKSLMKLDQSSTTSSEYPRIKKAIDWAVKADRQYPGICNRLGLGKDWDHATRQLLGIEPVPPTSDLYPALYH